MAIPLSDTARLVPVHDGWQLEVLDEVCMTYLPAHQSVSLKECLVRYIEHEVLHNQDIYGQRTAVELLTKLDRVASDIADYIEERW